MRKVTWIDLSGSQHFGTELDDHDGWSTVAVNVGPGPQRPVVIVATVELKEVDVPAPPAPESAIAEGPIPTAG